MVIAGRRAFFVFSRRKVRTGQGRVVGNANPGQPEGKCHRKHTAQVRRAGDTSASEPLLQW